MTTFTRPIAPRSWALSAIMAACLGILGGCATAPDSKVPGPTVQVPEKFDAGPQGAASTEAQVLQKWWEAMGDPVLNDLVEAGLKANSDIRVAVDRLQEVRAYQTVAESAMYPNVDLTFGIGRSNDHTRAPGLPSMDMPRLDGRMAGIMAAWELDVLGGRRKDVEAVKEGVSAAQEGVYGAQMMVSSDIAQNYFEARGIEQRMALLQRGIKITQRTHAYAEGRYKAGQATQADVVRARSQVDYAESQMAPLRALLEVRLHRLAVLTNRVPQAVQSLPPLPATSRLPGSLPVRLPSEVLENRPDVRAAAFKLRSQAAQVGSARADLLPKFYLAFAAQDGRVDVDLPGIPDGNADIQAIGLGVRLPIFTAGRLRAKIRMQEARLDARAAEYERSILNALEDVENAYTGRQALDQREIRLAEAVRLTQKAAENLETAFVGGHGLLLPVLETQALSLQREDELVQTRTLKTVTTVQLYKALGGGWQPVPDRSPANCR